MGNVCANMFCRSFFQSSVFFQTISRIHPDCRLIIGKIKRRFIMKKVLFITLLLAVLFAKVQAQNIRAKDVPAIVKEALAKKYPTAAKVSWEREKGNYEANWGGKSGEDTSVQFTPDGVFVEEVNAIAVSQLPANVALYVKSRYNGAKIKEAGKVADVSGKHFFEAEVKGKDLIFDVNGNFVKVD